jgi:hypothetical protein
MDNSEILIYQADDGTTKISVRFENGNVWLTQAQLVELYQSSKANVSEHIKHIFEESELDKISTVRNFRTVATNSKTYNMEYYNLAMIISLGYRIKSHIATKFRQWATAHLKAVDYDPNTSVQYVIAGLTRNLLKPLKQAA